MPIRVPEDLIALSRYRTIQLAELTYLEYSQSSLVKEVEVQMTQNSLLLPLAGEKVLHHGGRRYPVRPGTAAFLPSGAYGISEVPVGGVYRSQLFCFFNDFLLNFLRYED
jgi:hypothetical protein